MVHMHIQCESRSIRSGVGCVWDQEEGEKERGRKEKKKNVEDYECRAASVGFDGQVYTHERLSPHA